MLAARSSQYWPVPSSLAQIHYSLAGHQCREAYPGRPRLKPTPFAANPPRPKVHAATALGSTVPSVSCDHERRCRKWLTPKLNHPSVYGEYDHDDDAADCAGCSKQ